MAELSAINRDLFTAHYNEKPELLELMDTVDDLKRDIEEIWLSHAESSVIRGTFYDGREGIVTVEQRECLLRYL